MHKSFVDLKEDVEIIQTNVKVLESAIPTTTSTSSAEPSASGYYYDSSGGRSAPGAAFGCMLVEGVIVALL